MQTSEQFRFHFYPLDLVRELSLSNLKYKLFNLNTFQIIGSEVKPDKIFSLSVKDSNFDFRKEDIEYLRKIENLFFNVFFERSKNNENISVVGIIKEYLEMYKSQRQKAGKVMFLNQMPIRVTDNNELMKVRNKIEEFNNKNILFSFEKSLILFVERINLYTSLVYRDINEYEFIKNFKRLFESNEIMDIDNYKFLDVREEKYNNLDNSELFISTPA